MPQDYYSLVTNQGLIKEAASNEPGGTAIDLTEMAVGDSNGTYYDPDGSETALVNEVHRVNLTHVVVDENNANQLIVEAVLDETIGPFYIREVGIFDSNGDLFAIGKYPETFKPNLPAGSGKRLYIRMILGFANSPNVNLVINNDIALDPNFGTDVNNALAERLIKTNNLSDLSNISDARNNLDVYSKQESDDNFVTPLVGDYKQSAQNTSHNKWLLCNGSEISRTTYPELFSVIGTSFGVGNGSTTFNLPDPRGRVIGIEGQGSGLTNRNQGDSTGSETHTLTVNEMPSHNHNITCNATNGGAGTASPYSSVQSSSYTNTDDIQSTGGSAPHNNMQPTLFMGNLFIYSGV